MATVRKLFQTEISDEELYALIMKYGNYFYKMFTYKWGYHVEKDEIVGELAVTACEAIEAYRNRKTTTANIKTFIITAFKRRMLNYRDYVNIRQRKHPMLRIISKAI